MIQIGTLEGIGPNKRGTTDASASALGYTSMTANASTSPATQMLGKGGPNKLNDPSSPLNNLVNTSNDTDVLTVPEGGTLESGGING